MAFEKPAREVLRFLFSEYLKGPTVLYTISSVTRRLKIDEIELTDYLLENFWIRERWIYPDNSVACKITIRGIEEINPTYVRNKLTHVIGGLGTSGGSKDLMEIMEFNIEEYSITLDLIRQLESLGLVRMSHRYSHIIIELTDDGWRYYKSGSRTLFTLMMMA
jgi:hypothetical protein